MYAGPSGLTFHVQHGLAGQSQCSVDMPNELFREYFVGEEEVWLEDDDDDEGDGGGGGGDSEEDDGGGRSRGPRRCTREIVRGGEFGVNLTTVLECFSILSKTGNRPPSSSSSSSSYSSAGGGDGGGEYASLSNVPLCMSYDRGTATFHLEFLEGGFLGGGASARGAGVGGGCLVTCEVPGVAVADDVDDGPDYDGDDDGDDAPHHRQRDGNKSGLASAFRSSPIVSRAILRSDALQSAVSELYDVPGATVASVSLSTRGGLELGCVGPRSEVRVTVPYVAGQRGGMYVGMECRDAPGEGGGGDENGNDIAWRYPLGAFLSGMRGLDIGVETCISVNARGMMAIQHQVSRRRDAPEGGGAGGGDARPSFVDFIMTCIEDEEDDEGYGGDPAAASRGDAAVRPRTHRHGGLQDITNTESDDLGGRKARDARSTEIRARDATTVSTSGERGKSSSSDGEDELEEQRTRKTGREGKRHDDAHGDGDFDGENEGAYDGCERDDARIDDADVVTTPKRQPNDRDNAASRLLAELEVDKDLLSSSHNDRSLSGKGRKDALEDIRRRRQERQQQRQCFERNRDLRSDESDNGKNGVDLRANGKDSSDDRKLVGVTSKAGFRKARNCEGANDHIDEGAISNDGQSDRSTRHSNSAQDSQTQSEDDGEGDATELEDSLDVTAEIPNLFSKRSSLSTSAHGGGKRRKGFRGSNDRYSDDDDDGSESEMKQEPRMMYGDTKLEFTQDGYSD